MPADENAGIKTRIEAIRQLAQDKMGSTENFEAASLAQSVLYDTVGSSHPLMAAIDHALKSADFYRAVAASRSVVALYDEGALQSPRLKIAHEIEGDFIDIAQGQAQSAETSKDPA